MPARFVMLDAVACGLAMRFGAGGLAVNLADGGDEVFDLVRGPARSGESPPSASAVSCRLPSAASAGPAACRLRSSRWRPSAWRSSLWRARRPSPIRSARPTRAPIRASRSASPCRHRQPQLDDTLSSRPATLSRPSVGIVAGVQVMRGPLARATVFDPVAGRKNPAAPPPPCSQDRHRGMETRGLSSLQQDRGSSPCDAGPVARCHLKAVDVSATGRKFVACRKPAPR